MPPCYAFNEVVGVDILYITFNYKKIPFLNMVCDGTNLQVVAAVRDVNNEIYSGTPYG